MRLNDWFWNGIALVMAVLDHARFRFTRMPQVVIAGRRFFLIGAGAGFALMVLPRGARASAYPPIKAFRNPGCGCCSKWAAHMRAAGFDVEMEDHPDLDAKRRELGVPAELAGCHTAVIGNQVIEGHVPAEDVIRFLKERPDAKGIAVADMPVGSPGMEMGEEREAYDVMVFGEGAPIVFRKVAG